MGATKYNGAYKGEVIASLKQAMSGLKSCKSVSIDIPSDFEAAGTLRNASYAQFRHRVRPSFIFARTALQDK